MRTFKKFYFKRYSNELKIYLNYSQKTNTKNNLIMLISNDSLVEINCKTTLLFDESAKLRPLRGHVPTCLACLRAHVPTCLACLRTHVPTCLACLRAQVPCVSTCSRDIITTNKNKFSITSFPYIFVIILCLFPVKEKCCTFLHFSYQAEAI